MQDVANSLSVRPCVNNGSADTTGTTGVLFRAALSGSPSSTAITLPDGAKGAWLSLMARGQAVQYAFRTAGGSAPTLVFDQAVTAGTGHAAAGAHINAGERVDVEVPPNATHLHYMWASATAGTYFEGYVSSRKG